MASGGSATCAIPSQSELYFLTNLLSQTTQSFPSLASSKAPIVTTPSETSGQNASSRKAPVGAARLPRFGSSDSDMEQITFTRDGTGARKIGLDASSGAGDGSNTAVVDTKSMSDFFSELEEEMSEGFLPPGLMSDYALRSLDPFASSKACDEAAVDGDKFEKEEFEHNLGGKLWRKTGTKCDLKRRSCFLFHLIAQRLSVIESNKITDQHLQFFKAFSLVHWYAVGESLIFLLKLWILLCLMFSCPRERGQGITCGERC